MTQALNSRVTLRSLLGNHAGTAALKAGRVSSPLVAFEYADVKVVNTQFTAMMRDLEYDFGEIAINTGSRGVSPAHGEPRRGRLKERRPEGRTLRYMT